MFKSKAAIGVMLAGILCGSVLMCAIECAEGSEACDAWSYATLMGIIALSTAVIWMVISKK